MTGLATLWRHRAVRMVLFSVGLILVDAVSFIHPIGQLNITPWNPPAAVLVLFIAWLGLGALPWAYLSLSISDWVVRGATPLTLQNTLGNAVLVLCYASIALALHQWMRWQPLASQRRQIAGMSVIMASGALLTGAIYIGTLRWLGLVQEVPFWDALYRFFIGDLLGMMVPLPIAFLLLDPRRARTFVEMLREPSFWTLLLLLALCLAWLMALPQVDRLSYFFPVFLVVGLMAATHSLPGATLACLLVQLLLVYTTSHDQAGLSFLLEMQWVVLTLNLTGLLIGTVVDERRDAEARLRDSLQLVAAGQLAGSLAHELHQPLSALNAYAESALMLSQAKAMPGKAHPEALLQQTLRQLADETTRAAEVVRGLRRFFIAGESRVQSVDLSALVRDCVARLHAQADAGQVQLDWQASALPTVYVDPTQIATALTNVLKNAIEASAPGQTVRVRASVLSGHVEVRVHDQAPVLSPAQADRAFRPFFSDKLHGLGLGLSISRSLVENNGGSLFYDNAPSKCFVIRLPSEHPSDAR